MLLLYQLTFNLCTRPKYAAGQPMLISFSDASIGAFGACVCVRWELSDGSYKSSILISKGRVAPLKCITIVNLELSAAVLASRLRTFLEKECRFNFNRFLHIVDSEIVRSMIQKESYGFNTFVATRIGEIQQATNPTEWFWVSGEYYIANILTRGIKPEKLGIDSTWQNGPLNTWPIIETAA